jgi:hypothetical protein
MDLDADQLGPIIIEVPATEHSEFMCFYVDTEKVDTLIAGRIIA